MEWMVVLKGWFPALHERAAGQPVCLLLVKTVQAVTGVQVVGSLGWELLCSRYPRTLRDMAMTRWTSSETCGPLP